MEIEHEAELILEKFSEALENIPELEETHYMVDNLNLTREDVGVDKNPDKILRNAHVDKDCNVIAEVSKWVR